MPDNPSKALRFPIYGHPSFVLRLLFFAVAVYSSGLSLVGALLAVTRLLGRYHCCNYVARRSSIFEIPFAVGLRGGFFSTCTRHGVRA